MTRADERSGVRRMAIVTHSVVEEDPRIRRESEALVAGGWEVDVFSLRGPSDAADAAGVRLVPIDVGRHQGAGLPTYLAEYGSFFVRAGFALVRAHRRRRYQVVQIAAPPDPLILAALPLRLAGVPLILDLHEATPVFFKSRFPGATNAVTDAILHLAERISIAQAKAVISVNHPRNARLLDLGYRADKLHVVTNGPSLGRFQPEMHPVRPFMEDGILRIVYTGAVTPLYELDVVIRAIARIRDERPNLPVVFDVYGRGDAESGLRALAADLGIGDRVTFHGRVPLEAIAPAVAAIDIGVSPIRRDPFTEISMPTKALEYAVMGKPAIAADLPAARDHFDPEMLSWYESGDPASMAAAILRLVDQPDAREAGAAAAGARARDLSWDRESRAYVELVDAVAGLEPAVR